MLAHQLRETSDTTNKKLWTICFRTLQSNKVKYDPYSTTNPIKPGANIDIDTRLAFACRNNIPEVDILLKEHVGLLAMAKNTLANAFFVDVKKIIKHKGYQRFKQYHQTFYWL